jgi:hypothetical protein
MGSRLKRLWSWLAGLWRLIGGGAVGRQGRTVNGKRTAAVHRVAARFDVERQSLWVDMRDGPCVAARRFCELFSLVFRVKRNYNGQIGNHRMSRSS